VIVVDNASTDQSLAGLPPLENLEQILLPENLGFAAGNNIGIKRLENIDYIITLNPDAFPELDFIQTLEGAARTYPNYASYACRMMLDPDTLDGAGDAYHFSGFVSRRLRMQPLYQGDTQPREVFSPCSAAAMYQAATLEKVGGFDESFFCYMEDVDLGYRLQLRGHHCIYIPDATVLHLGSAITRNYPGFAVYHGHRNLVWVLVKNTPTPLLLLVVPSHLLLSIVVFFVCLVRGQARNFLKARMDALRDLKRVIQQRRTIQLERSVSSWNVLKSYDFRMASDWKSRINFL
jgi:GT2 family glycosyltransferase